MGRGKVVMKRIENATTRHLTFCTRRLALLKRARELSALCDAEVALIGFSSSGTSLFEYAGPRSMQEIIQAYFDTHQGEEDSLEACFPSQVMERLKEEVQRLEKEERRSGDMKELKLLSIGELEKLESELARDLNSVRERKEQLITEQRKEFVMKEQELRRENEILRKELMWTRCGVEEAAVTPCSDEDTMSSADSSGSDLLPVGDSVHDPMALDLHSCIPVAGSSHSQLGRSF